MEEHEAIKALAALAQDHRLKVFQLLMKHLPNGLPAGQIAARIGTSASTMSAHLAQLERAGFLRSWREQRHIYYAANLDGIRYLLTFLTEDCCGGHPELCDYGSPLSPLAHEREKPMNENVFHVLFLCTGNSAHSIMAESILNHLGQGTFIAHSAGSQPKGAIQPYAQEPPRLSNGTAWRSKSWDEWSGPNAPSLDFIITLCDSAAQEACPIWPGQPITAHWGLPDPAAVEGSAAEQQRAFVDTLHRLTRRVSALTELPSLNRQFIQQQLQTIHANLRDKKE